ncbi:hypothetical protein ACJO2E_08775 [Marinobacter sp. M1N3S26]|uniref:hypothetical protein n=1 Tax=Marinobacter sp. M1N3S26 TaxID=3382299 RepID=UPI00387AEBB3
MSTDIFAGTSFGKAALKVMSENGPLPENFRLYEMGWMEDRPEDFRTMKVSGAQFREAKTGPNKGKLSIMVDGTQRTVYVTKRDLEVE